MTADQHDSDLSDEICVRITEAAASRTSLCIVGGGTKAFYGNRCDGKPLELAGHHGVVDYEPTELVVTVRAGTRLDALESLLTAEGQMLGFEPPHFGAEATVGGTVACGFSGPRRPYAGSARDFVLGSQIVNGKGERMNFGGRVMKNVAGYDVSRLMVGAMGTLGVLLQVSMKILPGAKQERTVVLEMEASAAIQKMSQLAAIPIPISATCHVANELYIRLSGSAAGVQSAIERIGHGHELEPKQAQDFWHSLKESQLSFFQQVEPLWRISVPPAAPTLDIPGEWLLEWSGGLRWLATDADAKVVRDAAAAAGGYATLFRGDSDAEVFSPLSSGVAALHRNLKHAFDPHRILNPGRMYGDI